MNTGMGCLGVGGGVGDWVGPNNLPGALFLELKSQQYSEYTVKVTIGNNCQLKNRGQTIKNW